MTLLLAPGSDGPPPPRPDRSRSFPRSTRQGRWTRCPRSRGRCPWCTVEWYPSTMAPSLGGLNLGIGAEEVVEVGSLPLARASRSGGLYSPASTSPPHPSDRSCSRRLHGVGVASGIDHRDHYSPACAVSPALNTEVQRTELLRSRGLYTRFQLHRARPSQYRARAVPGVQPVQQACVRVTPAPAGYRQSVSAERSAVLSPFARTLMAGDHLAGLAAWVTPACADAPPS